MCSLFEVSPLIISKDRRKTRDKISVSASRERVVMDFLFHKIKRIVKEDCMICNGLGVKSGIYIESPILVNFGLLTGHYTPVDLLEPQLICNWR